ncbi:probable 39S ribosomal protein L49, mitochondrial [Varroa destructor]|uniref:Large ribosomal subunit protein mL49 n=1 Tax=Varroa destructor TaxID=109461 RepID=A0A7M7KBR7_VARDE|nr:probable 39S ribosomal protein L49, mitochondrial [Varroa destructor]
MCHEVQGKRCTSRRECNKKDNGTSISANFFGRWNEVKPVNQIGSGEGLDEMPSTLARLALPSVQPHRKYAVEVPDEHRHNFDPENPNLTKFEVVDDPEVWKYVERILPQRTIPPSPKEEGASGWKPARLTREEARNLPYFVARTKNHMLPVYLKEEVRGPRYITYVCKVHGDPWALRNELKLYLDELFPQQHIVTKVNELTQKVGFKGKFVNEITEFLLKKGF